MINKSDVLDVAKSLGKPLTDIQVQFILKEYPGWQATDPAANWDSVVEDLIYFVLKYDTTDDAE